jgi:Rrf2 family protein
VRVSAKAEYAARACVELAARQGEPPVSVEALAGAQGLPVSFLERIVGDLRRAGIVASTRGAGGGYRLTRSADEVTLADVIRAVDGPLVFVRGTRPPDLAYDGAAEPLLTVWVALRASVRSVLESVTLAHLARGDLPPAVRELAAGNDAWSNP